MLLELRDALEAWSGQKPRRTPADDDFIDFRMCPERDVTFIEDPRDLTEQVVDDLLVQKFHRKVAFDFPRDSARRIAEAVITNGEVIRASVVNL